jgi:hypothetical protein
MYAPLFMESPPGGGEKWIVNSGLGVHHAVQEGPTVEMTLTSHTPDSRRKNFIFFRYIKTI